MRKLAVFVVVTAWVGFGCSDGSPGDESDSVLGQNGRAGASGQAGSGGAAGMTGTAGSAGTRGAAGTGAAGSGADAGNGTGSAGAGGTHQSSDAGGGDSTVDAEADAGTEDEDPLDIDPGTDDPDGDGDTTWPPPPATQALLDVPRALAEGACGALEACLRPTLLELSLGGADCVPRTTAEIEDADFVYLQASIDEGRIVFDPSAIDACRADTRALGCDLLESRSPSSCEQVLQGQVAAGEACVLDDDCVTGAFCDRSAACPGVCTALRAEGGACTRADMCQGGLRCLEGTCGTAAPLGEDCEGSVAPSCHLGLLCVGADAAMDQPGSCTDQDAIFGRQVGETCDAVASEWCDDGLACVIELAPAAGQTQVEQVCRARGESGAACELSLVPQQCPRGEYCTADGDPDVTGVCETLPGHGQPCTTLDQCAADHYCDASSVCRALGRRLGAVCEVGQHCWSGRCAAGVCVAPARCRLDGTACGDGACDEDETCETCAADCGACNACGNASCDSGETCASCQADCGACPPACGDASCNGQETCTTCVADCGACPPVCGDDVCDARESCESCRGDCGACAEPYAACDAEADCAPSATCVETHVDGLWPFPDADFAYCAAPCTTANDCTGPSAQRACSAEGDCYVRCSLFELCPFGMDCVDERCTWLR